MKPISGSRGRADICTGPWIPQANHLIFCSRQSVMRRQQSDSFLRHCGPSNPQPRVINVDKNRAYPPAVEELKVEGTLQRHCRLRRCKYLNNVVEQHHRVSKASLAGERLPLLSDGVADITGNRSGAYERKGRARWVSKGDPLAQLQFYRRAVGADHLTMAISARETVVARTQFLATIP